MINFKPAAINSIKGVFFDYGGVLEDVSYKEESFNKGIKIIDDLLTSISIKIDPEQLKSILNDGIRNYSLWYKKDNYRELQNDDIWVKFLLQDICKKEKSTERIIREKSEELSSIFEFYLYFRRPKRGIYETLKTIFNLGYTIALVSNTISKTLIPERLEKLNVKRFFSSIVLSVEAGIRKPQNGIFEIALRETNLKASQCIYIGDTLSRDVEGSKNSGFASSILIPSKITEEKDSDYSGFAKPDVVIHSLKDILELL